MSSINDLSSLDDPTLDPSYYDETNPASPFYNPAVDPSSSKNIINPATVADVDASANDDLEKIHKKHRRHMRRVEAMNQSICSHIPKQLPGNAQATR